MHARTTVGDSTLPGSALSWNFLTSTCNMRHEWSFETPEAKHVMSEHLQNSKVGRSSKLCAVKIVLPVGLAVQLVVSS